MASSKEGICGVCGAPTQDDEGICCAEQEATWQCSSCSARLVAFAFPLGRCPRCDGELEAVERPDVADPEVVEAIRHAVEIELGGVAFYSDAAERAEDAQVKAFFTRMAAMEKQHLAQLRDQYHLGELPGTEHGVSLASTVVYGGAVETPTSTRGALELALALERRARDFLLEMRSQLPVGSAARMLLSELADEERGHVELLRDSLGNHGK